MADEKFRISVMNGHVWLTRDESIAVVGMFGSIENFQKKMDVLRKLDNAFAEIETKILNADNQNLSMSDMENILNVISEFKNNINWLKLVTKSIKNQTDDDLTPFMFRLYEYLGINSTIDVPPADRINTIVEKINMIKLKVNK